MRIREELADWIAELEDAHDRLEKKHGRPELRRAKDAWDEIKIRIGYLPDRPMPEGPIAASE